MYIDYKCNVWIRMNISDEEEFHKTLQSLRTSKNPSEVLNNTPCELETLFETENVLEPFENGGESTIEVYSDSGSLVWENSDEV